VSVGTGAYIGCERMKLKLIDIWLHKQGNQRWEVWSSRHGWRYFDIYEYLPRPEENRNYSISWVFEVPTPHKSVEGIGSCLSGNTSIARTFMELEWWIGEGN